MSRLTDYVTTLTPAERERFADLIEDCRRREAQIAAGARQADQALGTLAARERELQEGIRELGALSVRLRDTVSRLYLVMSPPQGRVS